MAPLAGLINNMIRSLIQIKDYLQDASAQFPGASGSKASACNAGDLGLIPRLGRSPGKGNGNPLQYSCHGQRSLAGYSPCGHKESDTTEQLTHFCSLVPPKQSGSLQYSLACGQAPRL